MVNDHFLIQQTQLSLVNKPGHFSSIWSYLANTSPDMTLLCHGHGDQVYLHTVVLVTLSHTLYQLMVNNNNNTDIVLILPETNLATVNLLVDLLYNGSCVIKQTDWFDLRELLNMLGMYKFAEKLEIVANIEKDDSDTSANENVLVAREPEHVLSLENVDQFYDQQDIMKTYFCQMCGENETSNFSLRVHYTIKHFFSEVAELVDKSSDTCELCGKKFEAETHSNTYRNIVRHRGATHGEVLPFVRNMCGGVEISCEECKICQVSVRDMARPAGCEEASCSVLGHHLIEVHFKEKFINLISSGQSICHLCQKKCKSEKMLTFHIGLFHGFAMKFYRKLLKNTQVIQSAEKKPIIGIRKKCKFCNQFIAAAGTYWLNPLYSHYSRKHFSKELLRDFQTDEKACSICGLKNISTGNMVAHLGVKHRLVEKYLDTGSSQDVNKKLLTRKNNANKKVIDDESNNLAQPDAEDSSESQEESDSDSSEPKQQKYDWQKFTCELCKKMMRCRLDLQVHMAAIHFKKDIAEAIRILFDKTGGVCPLCPDFQWTKESNKSLVSRHFARRHAVAEDLIEMDDEVYQPNVQDILNKLLPKEVNNNE